MSQSTTRYPPKQWGNNHLNMYTVSCIQFKGYFNISSQVSYKKLSFYFYNLKKLENPHINIAQNDTEANIQQSFSSMIVWRVKNWHKYHLRFNCYFSISNFFLSRTFLSNQGHTFCGNQRRLWDFTLHKTSSVYKI